MAKPKRFGGVDAYVEALGDALTECPPKVEELLRAHYQARGHVRTYPQLAETVGYANYGGVNSQYGRLARRVAVSAWCYFNAGRGVLGDCPR
jgi:hypothetical protein